MASVPFFYKDLCPSIGSEALSLSVTLQIVIASDTAIGRSALARGITLEKPQL